MRKQGLWLTEVLCARDADRVLGRIDEDERILAFARWAEARLRRWVDFRSGALLFLTVPDDPESGSFHLFDRASGSFWLVDIAADGRYGGYREDEFDALAETYGLQDLARNPPRRAVA